MPGSEERQRRAREAGASGAGLGGGRQHRPAGSESADHEDQAADPEELRQRARRRAAAITPVAPAPAMPPRLNMPCSDDMIGRQ